MTGAEYKLERTSRGLTAVAVAAELGIHWTTQIRRENGMVRVTREAEISIKSLKRPTKKVRTKK